MMIRSSFLIAASALMLVGAPAYAAPCKDAHGKFTKCSTAKTVAAPHRCKLNGKFAKCGTSGAKPA